MSAPKEYACKASSRHRGCIGMGVSIAADNTKDRTGMVVFLFSAILVGLPMALGVHVILARGSAQDFGFGTGAIIYAVALASVFAILMPDGNVLDANFRLKMPAAVAVGALIGLASGLIMRLRKK